MSAQLEQKALKMLKCTLFEVVCPLCRQLTLCYKIKHDIVKMSLCYIYVQKRVLVIG